MPPPPAKKFASSSQASSTAAAGTTDSPAPIPLGRVVPKVPAAPRPPIFLKVDHLTDPKKGIASLPKVLIPEGEGQAPFKGKGHELEDLRLLLSRAKLWAHRLFPRITFEDFVERAEMLGSKRPVRNFLTRIRHGMPLTFGTTNEDGQLVDGLSDEEEEVVEGGEKNGAGGDQTAEDSSSAAAAVVVEDSESTAAAESTSEFKFDRLFREFSHSTAAASSSDEPLTTMIEEVKEDESGETASNMAEDSLAVELPDESQQQQQQSSSQQQKQPSVEEFDMDDDDFDEDFLSSFKP